MSRVRFNSTRARVGAALAALVVVAGGCGSGSPSAPVVTPSVVPTPTPTPVPQATPTPEPTPSGEAPVTRTEPPVRITLRFFDLEDPSGVLVPDYAVNGDGQPIVPVNYMFRLDSVAKDAKNKETIGDGKVTWHFSDDGIVEVINDSNPFQWRLRALRGGTLSTYVTMTGGKNAREVVSNTITVEFRY